MNFNRKPVKAEKPPDPNILRTRSHKEFLDVCARRDRGEFKILSFGVWDTPSAWWFLVAWPDQQRGLL